MNNIGGVAGGQFVYSSGAVVNLTGGNLSANAAGIVTGNITDSTGDNIDFYHGKLARNKTFMVGALRSGNTGAYVHLQATKYGGAFSTSDLAGTWYGYWVDSTPDAGCCVAVFDNAGTMTSGTLTSGRTGATVNIGGGSFSLDNNGILSGDLSVLQLLTAVNGADNYRIDAGEKPVSQGGWSTIVRETRQSFITDDDTTIERAVQTSVAGKIDQNKQFMGVVFDTTSSGGGPVDAGGVSGGGGGGCGCFVSGLMN